MIKKLVLGIGTLLLLTLAIFWAGQWVPIDPALSLVGEGATESSYLQAKEALGLHQSVQEQVWHYLTRLIHFDLGRSTITGRSVLEDLYRNFHATFELSFFALIIGCIGIPVGVMAAWKPSSIWAWLMKVEMVIYSMPTFVVAIGFLWLFYVRLSWSAGPGRVDWLYENVEGSLFYQAIATGNRELLKNGLSHLLLPASVLGLMNMATLSRLTRSLMIEQLTAPYVVTSLMKGLPERVVIWKHVFRNLRLPLLTFMVLSLSSLIEGALITETIFARPGLGSYLAKALQMMDFNALLGSILLTGAIFISLNVIVEIASPKIDRRIKDA